MSTLLFPAIVLVLLIGLYTYMYLGMMKIKINTEANKGVYTPNMTKSLIEIAIFLLLYLACSILVLAPEVHLGGYVSITVIAFFLSILTFNKLVVDKLGKWAILAATAVSYSLYTVVYLFL